MEFAQHEQGNDELHKLVGGYRKLSDMLLMQKRLLCKLTLGGESCGWNLKKFNTFGKASTPNVCVSESNKLNGAQVRYTKAFGK